MKITKVAYFHLLFFLHFLQQKYCFWANMHFFFANLNFLGGCTGIWLMLRGTFKLKVGACFAARHSSAVIRCVLILSSRKCTTPEIILVFRPSSGLFSLLSSSGGGNVSRTAGIEENQWSVSGRTGVLVDRAWMFLVSCIHNEAGAGQEHMLWTDKCDE